MTTLRIIRDEDFGLRTSLVAERLERQTSRVVIFDKDGKIALLNVTKRKFHKLPGGGLEEGESFIDALKRETKEEIGCEVSNFKEIGIIEEFRERQGLHQISHCFIGSVKGEKGLPNFEQGEIDDGFEIVWLELDEAIKILESEVDVEDYEGKFIRLRELTFLKEAEKYLATLDKQD